MFVQTCPAQASDVPAILAIYNDAVLNTTASWDYQPQPFEQRMAWFEKHQEQGLPVIVAINEDGKVLGWGSLSEFRERIGYRFTVEHSVYVAAEYRGQGIGRLIVQTLIDEARRLGKHVLIGGVDQSNQVSLRLHESLGFEQVAHIKQVGYKFDRWLDLVFFQLILTPQNQAQNS
jgi:phosphinothricin acetyltransferase